MSMNKPYEHTAICPDTAKVEYTPGACVTIKFEDEGLHRDKAVTAMLTTRTVPALVRDLVQTLDVDARKALIASLVQGL